MKRWCLAASVIFLLTVPAFALEREENGEAVWEMPGVDGQRLCLPVAAGYRWVAGGSVIGIAAGSEDPLGRVQLYLQVRQEGEMPAGVDPHGLLELLRGKGASVVWLGEERGFCPIGGTGG